MTNEPPDQNRQSRTALRQKIIHLLLRSLPFPVPGPELYELLREVKTSRTSLGKKVQQTSAALHDASELVTELESALEERIEQVEKLRAEYERYSKLAEVEEEKAGALLKQLQLTVDRGKGRDRFISLALNVFAGLVVFVLGVFIGPWLTQVLRLFE